LDNISAEVENNETASHTDDKNIGDWLFLLNINLLVTFCISCCPFWKCSVEQNIAIFPLNISNSRQQSSDRNVSDMNRFGCSLGSDLFSSEKWESMNIQKHSYTAALVEKIIWTILAHRKIIKEFILGFCINLGTYREPILDICYIDLNIGYFFSLAHSAYFIPVVG